jgi:hypothetical protein
MITPTTTSPSLRAVKFVGGAIVIGAILAGVGYAMGYDTFAAWAQLAATLVGALFGAAA